MMMFILQKINAVAHLGQKDMNIIKARRLIGNKIVELLSNSIKLEN